MEGSDVEESLQSFWHVLGVLSIFIFSEVVGSLAKVSTDFSCCLMVMCSFAVFSFGGL
jgi:hypothetical protein